jgi:hypothetical protein
MRCILIALLQGKKPESLAKFREALRLESQP